MDGSFHVADHTAKPATIVGLRRLRGRRGLGIHLGLVATAGFMIATWIVPLHVKGPMNAGHGDLSCESCHRPAPGTIRQQLQASARHSLGLREQPVEFGSNPVASEHCQRCHLRPNDLHPVSRFFDPGHQGAPSGIRGDDCTACHAEHTGKRVTADSTLCGACHDDLEIADDPLDVPHAQLRSEGRWETCLGCHDYHGNHVIELPTKLANSRPRAAIEDYFAGGAAPYGEPLHAARKEVAQP
jgi:hypothetical protein